MLVLLYTFIFMLSTLLVATICVDYKVSKCLSEPAWNIIWTDRL